MARKDSIFVVSDDNRDKGKRFIITEMSASQAESWATRALLALMNANVELPDGFESFGMAALVELGMKSLSSLRWEILEPLLAEMMGCVEIAPDPSKTHVRRPLIEDDIEEVLTRFHIRREWWELHMGFLRAVAPSVLEQNRGTAAASKPRVTRMSRR